MLFSISFRSVQSCNTVYTYTAVCKYLFAFIYILSLYVYIFHILDYAPGGGQRHFHPLSFVSLLPFVPSLKDSGHGYPLTVINKTAPASKGCLSLLEMGVRILIDLLKFIISL